MVRTARHMRLSMQYTPTMTPTKTRAISTKSMSCKCSFAPVPAVNKMHQQSSIITQGALQQHTSRQLMASVAVKVFQHYNAHVKIIKQLHLLSSRSNSYLASLGVCTALLLPINVTCIAIMCAACVSESNLVVTG